MVVIGVRNRRRVSSPSSKVTALPARDLATNDKAGTPVEKIVADYQGRPAALLLVV
jgi:hypothetical protein